MADERDNWLTAWELGPGRVIRPRNVKLGVGYWKLGPGRWIHSGVMVAEKAEDRRCKWLPSALILVRWRSTAQMWSKAAHGRDEEEYVMSETWQARAATGSKLPPLVGWIAIGVGTLVAVWSLVW